MNLAVILKKVFSMQKPPTVADYDQLVAAAEQELLEARRSLDNAQVALDRDLFRFKSMDDQVGANRLRKAVRASREEVAEKEDDLARTKRMRDEAIAREQRTDFASRRVKAERIASLLQEESAQLEATMDKLAEQLNHFAETAVALRAALPAPVDVVEERCCMWSHDTLQGHVQLQLFAKTNGLLLARAVTQSAFMIRQGPNFQRRVRESIEIALRNTRKAAPSNTPPEAA